MIYVNSFSSLYCNLGYVIFSYEIKIIIIIIIIIKFLY